MRAQAHVHRRPTDRSFLVFAFIFLVIALLALMASAPSRAQPPSFLTFESGHVRPLALAPDGKRLYAVNTPDNRLEVFDVSDEGLTHVASVPVGLEPVAVLARHRGEVWVVNHLSDSVSILDVAATPPRVVRTLLVGDEPRDIVFAGPNKGRAFITTAHRGQHRDHETLADVPGAGDPEFSTPGVSRADVWVFDTLRLGHTVGGTPIAILELFGDTPRALAVTPDRGTVYAAVFFSGNRTTTVPEPAVCDGFVPADLANACPDEFVGAPGGLPGPATNHEGAPAPEVGLIVRQDEETGEWHDELGRDWSAAVRFELPDHDVFRIDASTLETTAEYSGVGTVLFNMAVHPTTGDLYVSNTEAQNEVRFEGPGSFGGSTVQGHLHEARITVIRDRERRAGEAPGEVPGAQPPEIVPRHLNRHIDYSVRPAPPEIGAASLATPLQIAFTADGSKLYVAAFGSSKIGVFDTAALAAGNFDPLETRRDYLEVAGGGPTGIVLDEERGRIYVQTRFDNSVAVLELASGEEVERIALYNPEPRRVVEGRPVLYNARAVSSNGEASCASCHIFADFDGLAWDLGDPDGNVTRSPIPMLREQDARISDPPINGNGDPRIFHPMKGPMTTQTLRGLKTSGAMHWRGDRSNGFFGVSPGNEDLSFRNFIVAFTGLVGAAAPPTTESMQQFTDFVLDIVLPPNPVRSLDNALTEEEERGKIFFTARLSDSGIGAQRCSQCHFLEPRLGNYGTRRLQSFAGVTQTFKVPHLRNLYQKIGMFGHAEGDLITPGDNAPMGPQVRGFGFLHDGSVDTLFRFLHSTRFNRNGDVGFTGDTERRAVEKYLLAFDNDLAPIVGQQITMKRGNIGVMQPRVELLIERAETPFTSSILGGVVTECELILKGVIDGELRGGFYKQVKGHFIMDRAAEEGLDLAELREIARRPGHELTFTCVPPGSGLRTGLDRDEDGHYDRDELDAGSDPADPASVPAGVSPG